jgi:hypothetical protein
MLKSVDTLAALTCEVCGESVPMVANDQGWPTLQHASDFLADHANCLAVIVTDGVSPSPSARPSPTPAHGPRQRPPG